jgi:hypothetical protein
MTFRISACALIALALAASLAIPAKARAQDQTTSANAGEWGTFPVGADFIHIELTGSAGERRPMDVILLFPADKESYDEGIPMVFSSRLRGVQLDPTRWDPISWTVAADRARDGVEIDRGGRAFPLIVSSHAAQSAPYNSAPTLERLASHGFIVAMPFHEGDTQDDRIIDVINQRAGAKFVPCFDAGSSPCLEPSTPLGQQKSIRDRALDVRALLDHMPGYFGDRIDMEHVGMLGQSRGSATALIAAGGSTSLNIAADPRIDAVMTTAAASRTVTFFANMANVTVPTLMVTGKIDRNSIPAITAEAFNAIASEEKGLVILERAEHGVYSGQRCSQMQATGAIFQANSRAIGEQLLFENIIVSANSGTPIDYCSYDYFVNPSDVLALVLTFTGIDVSPTNVPQDLDAADAMRMVLELANTFFDATLVKQAQPGVHFKQYMSPKFLFLKEGVEVGYAETQSFQGTAAICDDPEMAALPIECE